MGLTKLVGAALASAILLAAAPASAMHTDITSVKGLTFGSGASAKFVAWGGSVNLSENDAFVRANGKCAFNVSYDMTNLGDTATAAFKNYLSAKDAVVAINSNLTLKAGESKTILTQPYMQPGTFGFGLKLDAENAVAESNELNNQFSVKVNLSGSCGGAAAPAPAPAPKADLVSQKGLAIGGAIGGAGGKTVAWNGTVVLTAANAFLTSNGKCAFNIMYDMANIGAAAAPNFTNMLSVGPAVISQQTGLSLDKGASRLVMTQAYLSPGTNVLVLTLDSGSMVSESNEANNTSKVTVIVAGACAPVTAGRK